MLRILLTMMLVPAAFAGPIQLTVTGSGGPGHDFLLQAPAGSSAFTFGPTVAGNLTVSGTLNAAFSPQSVSLTLTDASFACAQACGPSYGLFLYLELPFSMLPAGPLGVSVDFSGTATMSATTFLDLSTIVGDLNAPSETSSLVLASSGPFALTPPRPDVLLTGLAPDDSVFLSIGLSGAPSTFFQGQLSFPNSMSITVTQLPEPGTASLLGLVLALGAGSWVRGRSKLSGLGSNLQDLGPK